MKKILSLQTLFLYVVLINSYCGDNPNFFARHSKGSNGLILSLGSTTRGHYFSGGYSYYFTKYFFSDLTYSFEYGRFHYTDFSTHKLCLTGKANFFSYRKSIFCNADLGLFGGQEILKERLFDIDSGHQSDFIYGLSLGTHCEYFLTNKLCLDLALDQNFMRKSLIRSSYISYGLGFRIFF
ncbi:MAG: hypothetical protein Q8907_00170 [Bacteroidota bacterium]|nr:hypothetical protein [Bacteroidota bacterium]